MVTLEGMHYHVDAVILIVVCSPDQARSLASNMHNTKEFFQYFALDFKSELSAFHGSSVMAQAAFTNEALSRIAEAYSKLCCS